MRKNILLTALAAAGWMGLSLGNLHAAFVNTNAFVVQFSLTAVLAGNVPACISAGDVDGDGVREKRDLLDYSSAGITRPGASTNGRTPCAPPSPGDASSPTKENS